jgi:hypothetical protein
MHYSATVKISENMKNLLVLTFVVLFLSFRGSAQNSAETSGYFTVENYYKVKWGLSDEFISLWEKNHYPLLKKALEKGDIISIIA